MDTKERIQKFLQGRAISRQDYDEAKAGYEEALGNATDEQKQMATAYLQSVLNNQSANPKTNKHARHTGAEAYRIATTMLNGTFDEAAAQTPLGTTSVRTRRQDYADAGNVAADFMRKNANQQTTTGGIGRGTATSGGRYYFDALQGLNSIGESIGATRGSKVGNYARRLYENIKAAQDAENSGKTVYNGVDNMYNDLSKLQTLLAPGTDLESDAAYNTLLDIAGRYDTADHWASYFGDLLPMSSEIDKRKAALMRENGLTEYDLADQSEWARNFAKNKGYKFFKDREGNIRVYNRDYTDQIRDVLEYNSNFNDQNVEGKGFGHGFIADSEGNIYLGDTRNISADSPFAKLWNARLETDRAKRDNSYWDLNYQYGQNDSESPYLQALEKQFGSFKGSDVSSLFQGNDRIFVTSATPGQAYYDKDDYFGGITFNNNSKFYKVGDDGTVQEVGWDELKDKYNQNGWEGEGKEQLGTVIDLDDLLKQAGESSIDLNSDMGGRTFWTALLEAYGLDTIAPAAIGAAIGATAANGAAIGSYKGLSEWAMRAAAKNLGKDASQKALRKEAFRVAGKALENAVKKGALKGVVKKAAISGGVRAGIHGTLASTGIGALIGAGLGLSEAGIRYASYDNINEDIPGFVHNLLGAVSNVSGQLHTKLHGVHNNAQLLQNLDYNNQKDEYTKLLFQLFNQNPDLWNQLSQQEKNTFIAMKRAYNNNIRRMSSVQSEKEGGIVYAAKGTVINGAGEPLGNFAWQNPDRLKSDADIAKLRETYKKSNEAGYGDDIYRKQASEEKMFNGNGKMSTADTMRIATMAQDAASIVASFVPGAGTGVAAGLGVTALGTDLIADILDPAVTAGEVVKNAAMNAGFAGLGLIPGAKMGKVAKNIVRYLPKIVTAAAGLGIAMDESTQKTFKKLGDGTTKLNREDWRNISHVLSLVAAGTRGVKGDIARYKVKKSIIASDNVRIKGLTKTDANGKEIPFELPKEKVKAINEKLSKVTETKNGETTVTAKENAIKILTEDPDLKLTPEQAEAILKEPKGVGKLKTGKFSIESTETTNTEKTYDNLRAIWNREAQDVEASSKVGRWFANKFGGGEYTAKQRAMLDLLYEKPEDVGAILGYKGLYNPMIDWKGLRSKASGATYRIPARPKPVSETPKEQKAMLALPEWNRVEERINTPVEQTRVASEAPIKNTSDVPTAIKEKITLPKDAREAALQFAKAFGVEIKSQRDYFRFIQDLRKNNPELYRQFLSRRPMVNPAKFMAQAKAEYNFRDGGKVNYQKLRK